MKKRILTVIDAKTGITKMAPVFRQLEQHPDRFTNLVCVAGGHWQSPDPNVPFFHFQADYDLEATSSGWEQKVPFNRIVQGAHRVLENCRPDLVLVHGETPTALAASLAASKQGIAIGHIEAGLRPGSGALTCPGCLKSRAISRLAKCHFTHTDEAKHNLVSEGIDSDVVFVTGNTVIDSLHVVLRILRTDSAVHTAMLRRFCFLKSNKRLILVTGHQAGNGGAGVERMCTALTIIARNVRETEIVYQTDLDADSLRTAQQLLKGYKSIHLVTTSEYLPLVWLMNRCSFIISDSSTIQVKAPSLAKPVLVTRNTTDRPEAISAGTAKLVGIDPKNIAGEALQFIRNRTSLMQMSRFFNPYGDGLAAPRLVTYLPMALDWN